MNIFENILDVFGAIILTINVRLNLSDGCLSRT